MSQAEIQLNTSMFSILFSGVMISQRTFWCSRGVWEGVGMTPEHSHYRTAHWQWYLSRLSSETTFPESQELLQLTDAIQTTREHTACYP